MQNESHVCELFILRIGLGKFRKTSHDCKGSSPSL